MFTILLLPRFPVTFSATVSSGTWGKKLIEPFRYLRKKKRKEKENQSTYIVYLQKERNDWKLFITRSILRRCPSKASRNHPLSFPFLFPINNATNRDEFRISFFKIKQGADDAVQDHPKKTRFGRTCSRRKTADRNQTLPLSLPHVHVTNSLSSVYIRSHFHSSSIIPFL